MLKLYCVLIHAKIIPKKWFCVNMRLIAIYGVRFGICNPFLVFFSIVITSFQCLVWLKLVVITSTTPRFTKVINSWVIHVHLYYLGSICSIPFRAFIWHLRAWIHMVLTECDQLKSIFKTRGPSNSLTWVSLSLVYSKRLWFLFIGLRMFKICWKECFWDDRLEGARQKYNCMVPYCWIGIWTRWSYVTKYQRPGSSGFREKDF